MQSYVNELERRMARYRDRVRQFRTTAGLRGLRSACHLSIGKTHSRGIVGDAGSRSLPGKENRQLPLTRWVRLLPPSVLAFLSFGSESGVVECNSREFIRSRIFLFRPLARNTLNKSRGHAVAELWRRGVESGLTVESRE